MRAYEYSINPAFKLFTSNQYISSLLFKTHENNHYSYSSDNINIPKVATKLRKIIIEY